MSTPGKWVVSDDEERFNCSDEFDTKEDAIAAAAEVLDGLEPGDNFWVGQIAEPQIPSIDASRVIERASEDMYDTAGEWGEEWLADVDPEEEADLQAELDKVWSAWIEKHGHKPAWSAIEKSECHTIPEREKTA